MSDEEMQQELRRTGDAEVRVKAREILRDYEAGKPADVIGDGWIVRFASHIMRDYEERRPSAGAEPEVVEAARNLLKSTLEIIESDGGYCEYTRWSEIVCRALLSVPRSVKDSEVGTETGPTKADQ